MWKITEQAQNVTLSSHFLSMVVQCFVLPCLTVVHTVGLTVSTQQVLTEQTELRSRNILEISYTEGK